MTDFLNSQFLGNTAQDWIIAAVLVVIVMVMVRTVIGIVLKRLSAIASKTETDVDDLVTELLEKTKSSSWRYWRSTRAPSASP